MTGIESRLKPLIVKLYEIEALKFGDFKMKVGINSPVYFDLRVVVSYPEIMEEISLLLWEFAREEVKCDQLCGVPYTALPIATLISVHARIPMLIRRKEAKKYGTRKLIEGKFKAGDWCIIIEDVVTTGSSILETVKDLQREGLRVTTAFVIVDREQGGTQNLAEHGIKMRSMCTLSKILQVLCEADKVDQETVANVKRYISACQIRIDGTFVKEPPAAVLRTGRLELPFADRAKLAMCPVGGLLLELMHRKQTMLCVAADLPTSSQLLSLAEAVGPHICLLKTHADVVSDWDATVVHRLLALADRHNFLLMEDRKFGDIGHTVSLQYSGGVHRISSWADLVTAHPLSGEGVIAGLKKAVGSLGEDNNRGCFLVAELSSEGNLITPSYTAAALKMCEAHLDFVCGVVCQSPGVVCSPGVIQLTPGVRIGESGSSDGLGQQYNSPEHAVLSSGADIAVVGRGISQAHNPGQVAKMYRDQLWAAYEQRIEQQAG